MDAIICPACGASNPVEATVCESCGEDLTTIKSVMDTANTHYNEALALAHGGRLDEAIGQLEAALALSSQNPNYHNLLGTVYAQKGLYSEAIDAWERCLSIDPEMEKAYSNIDKARHMEEDWAEEQIRRPFLLSSISLGVIAALLLVTTAYFGVKSYFHSSEISDLKDQLSVSTDDATKWKIKYEEFTKDFPKSGIDGLLAELGKLKGQLEEKEKQYDTYQRSMTRRLEQNRTSEKEQQDKIQELTNQINEQKREISRMSPMQAVINKNKNDILEYQKTIAEKDKEIKEANDRANDFRDKLVVAQNTIKSVKSDRDKALNNLTASKETAVEKMREDINQLRDEIAEYERRIVDMKYANGLVAEVLKNLENNNFQLAMDNTRIILDRVSDHKTAIYLQDYIQRILDDPLEQETRRQEALERERQRAQKRAQLAEQNLKAAKEYLDDGAYDRAIELAERAKSLSADHPKNLEESKKIIGQAESKNKEITMLILEARQNIEGENFRDAQNILKQVLKRSPNNPEATELMDQLSQ